MQGLDALGHLGDGTPEVSPTQPFPYEMESEDPELINYRHLETLVVLGPADFLDFLEEVSHDVPMHLDRIETAVRAGNIEEIKARAHSMRGMLANFGCIGMTSALHELEYVMSPAPDEAVAIRDSLQQLWRKSIHAIDQWRLTVREWEP